MLRRSAKAAGLLALACGAQVMASTPAHGSSLLLMNSRMLTLLQAAGAPNQCVSFAYDKNGNITVRTNQTYSSQAVWGSVQFGCFTWTPA